jgi:hypothetical protein
MPGTTHPATFWRWIVKGVSLRDGTRIKLPGVKSPGGWLVTPEALAAFLAALTADRLNEPAPAPPAITEVRRRGRPRKLDREAETTNA